MKLKKIEFLDKLNNFIDYSDEYININLERKISQFSNIWYYEYSKKFFLSIGEDGKINTIQIYDTTRILKSSDIIFPKYIINGDVFLESIKYGNDDIENIELEFLETVITNNIISCYFEKNKENIYYGVQISDKIVVLVGENNIMKGILINGKFKIENDRFYYEK
ncbi:hypothetical protein [Leptotrichia massiliensis]|uniref:hypothetical protein n=1 Tax=Leptotrichia massiliensis TaxID=1852388 RepID=UPI0028F0019D|nr:hypothetical protein [Leptotrichia massiliensis]